MLEPMFCQSAVSWCARRRSLAADRFLGDDDGSRFRAAYFERFPGVWAHGDFISRSDAGGFAIHGRSDATLNSGGVRIGTAEIYRVVDALADIEESIVVGQRDGLDTRIVLFVVLREGANLDEELQQQIRQALRSAASLRHVPAGDRRGAQRSAHRDRRWRNSPSRTS